MNLPLGITVQDRHYGFVQNAFQNRMTFYLVKIVANKEFLNFKCEFQNLINLL